MTTEACSEQQAVELRQLHIDTPDKSKSDAGCYDKLAKLWALRLIVNDDNALAVSMNLSGRVGTLSLLALPKIKVKSSLEHGRAAFNAELIALEKSAPPHRGPLFDNIALLNEYLPLTDIEREILAFRVLLHAHPIMRLVWTHCLRDVATNYDLHRVLAVMLDRSEHEIACALSPRSALCNSGLLRIAHTNSSGIITEKMTVLSGTGDAFTRRNNSVQELIAFAVEAAPPATLMLTDFPHLAEDIQLIVRFLGNARRNAERGVNVLLYGTPGLGKTELVRALAHGLGFSLYEVPCMGPDENQYNANERFGRYLFNQRMLARMHDTVLLFDEIEDIFPGPFQRLPVITPNPGGYKALINRTLEENPVPAFWIANNIRQIDPAYLRRFDLVLEIPNPPASVRRRILARHLEGMVDDSMLDEQARIERLSPATTAHTARVLRLAELSGERATSHFVRISRQSMEAQGLSQTRYSLPADYDPRYMRANVDPETLCRGLERSGSGRILLHGAPGTGKTAFAHYVAKRLDRELRVYRGSDLLSKWLGETEKNIARMFREARGVVVLLDEADSFLRDRTSAVRSWEVTGVNELLTQMELFDGIFIAATNFLETLDLASLRRFGVKVRFDYLDEEQRLALFRQTLVAGGDSALFPESVAAALRRLTNLTPGDFAAVRRRQELLDAPPTAATLLNALEEECRLKPDGGKIPMGF